MRYSYYCENCDKIETRDVSIRERDNQICEKCKNKLKRTFSKIAQGVACPKHTGIGGK